MKYCVIIPVYNSENHIAAVIRDVLQYTENIIVVDDGSTDNTAEEVKRFDIVRLVGYDKNIGNGYYIKKVFDLALT